MRAFRRILNKKGQTAIEYLLILAVSAGLGMTFLKKMEEYLVSNPNSYINNYLNAYKKVLKSDPKYKRFIVPR